MSEFHGLLSSDYGFKPQGKSAPMAPPLRPHNPNPNFTNSSSAPVDTDSLFRSHHSETTANPDPFEDVFGVGKGNSNSVNLDSIFGGNGGGGGGGVESGVRFSSLPVFDKPVYDDEGDGVGDDVFGAGSGSGRYEDVFDSRAKAKKRGGGDDVFGDLLGGLGKGNEGKGKGGGVGGGEMGIPGFDDLLPGFGANAATERTSSSSSWRKKSSASAASVHSNVTKDPFVVLGSKSSAAPSSSGVYGDPLGQMGNLKNSSSKKVDPPSSARVFDDIDPLEGLGKSVPLFSSKISDNEKDGSTMRAEHKTAGRHTFTGYEADNKSYAKSPDRGAQTKIPADDFRDSPENIFDIPSASDSQRSVPDSSFPSHADSNFNEKSFQENVSPRSQDNMDSTGDIWLTVSEVPLFTQPTAAPPPSRPPPPRPAQFSRTGAGYFTSQAKKKVDEYSSFTGPTGSLQSPRSPPVGAKNSFVSPIDELEDFAMGKNRNHVVGNSDGHSGEDMDANSVAAASAAAMKEAMDKAEAKFKHAKEVRERENAKAGRMQQERGERVAEDAQERELRERMERVDLERHGKEMEEDKRRREEEENRRIDREREEKEREQRRLERERQFARQAVDRANREARERAAIHASERAASETRAKAERAAVEKAQAEARERAERAAVLRAQAEARERAAKGAKEKADRAVAEARERARVQAKEAQEKANAAAAAAAARASQQKNDDDLESFFGMGSRASSAPRPRASSSDPFFDAQFPSKQTQDDARKSNVSAACMRKASSSTNIVDDLSDIIGGTPSSSQFQEVDGETEERRKARLERHQRTQDRTNAYNLSFGLFAQAKALAEKKERDLQAERERAERNRIAETTDIEIRRWAAGKEGNLRALLSTLQYALWPESGWQPVSLTDLITGASVKKIYRKANLCIHPDKVQQKGATLQQKYVAEKVFDILKEAWNKFNSEELF
ncbi:Auxilin-related protein [Drosera capensis]